MLCTVLLAIDIRVAERIVNTVNCFVSHNMLGKFFDFGTESGSMSDTVVSYLYLRIVGKNGDRVENSFVIDTEQSFDGKYVTGVLL